MLNKDFKEFAGLFRSRQVEFLIVGGYALAAYGHPRFTGDLDFWIGSDEANARKVLAVLNDFGMGSLGIGLADLTQPGQVIQLGYPPGCIDLLTSIDGVDFATCYAQRLTMMMDGVSLDFIGVEDFKKNKIATGRLKDLADLQTLQGKS
jgi:hypothetical protein